MTMRTKKDIINSINTRTQNRTDRLIKVLYNGPSTEEQYKVNIINFFKVLVNERNNIIAFCDAEQYSPADRLMLLYSFNFKCCYENKAYFEAALNLEEIITVRGDGNIYKYGTKDYLIFLGKKVMGDDFPK